MKVKRVSRIHHQTILEGWSGDGCSVRMVRWCVRLTRFTLVCEVIRYRFVQVRQNLKKKKGLAARNRLPLSLPLSFSSSSCFPSFSKPRRSLKLVMYFFLLVDLRWSFPSFKLSFCCFFDLMFGTGCKKDKIPSLEATVSNSVGETTVGRRHGRSDGLGSREIVEELEVSGRGERDCERDCERGCEH